MRAMSGEKTESPRKHPILQKVPLARLKQPSTDSIASEADTELQMSQIDSVVDVPRVCQMCDAQFHVSLWMAERILKNLSLAWTPPSSD